MNNKIKHGIKTPTFWAGIITSIVVAAAAEYGLQLEEVSVIGLITAIISFMCAKFVKNKSTNKGKK